MVKSYNKLKLVSLASTCNICCMENNDNIINNTNNNIKNIKSKYVLNKVLKNVNYAKKLNIVRYNKKLQSKLGLKLEDYIIYNYRTEIEIDILNFTNAKIKCLKKFLTFFKKKKDLFYIQFKINNEGEYKDLSSLKVLYSSNLRIKLKNKQRITDYSNFFYGCSFIKTINFIKFKETDVKNMSYMFYKCNNLKYISNINKLITKNVTTTSHMFDGCRRLKYLDLSILDLKNVDDMSYMFSNCKSLKRIIVSEKVNKKCGIKMEGIFFNCKSLTINF